MSVETARMKLIIRYPFFGVLAMYLEAVADPHVTQTAGTDGTHLYYNPEWMRQIEGKYGINGVCTVVAHEVMHVALGHLWRRGSRAFSRWNAACDFAINAILRSSGMPLPEGALYDKQYENLSAEEIYEKLPEDRGFVILDDHDVWSSPAGTGKREGPSGMSPAGLEKEWATRLASALEAARRQGDCPAGLARIVEKLLAPRISWRDVLSDFVQRARYEYTWYPSDRRFIHAGLYLPDYGGEGLPEIVVGVDTSGSISQRELTAFLSEVAGILAVNPMYLHLAICDAAVHEWVTVERGEEMPEVRCKGGGGTDFRPVFDAVEKRGIYPACLVFFTDACGTFPEREPPYPVLWVVVGDGMERVPWGSRVRMWRE